MTNIPAAERRLKEIASELEQLVKAKNLDARQTARMERLVDEGESLDTSIKATKQANKLSHMIALAPEYVPGNTSGSGLDSGQRLSFKGIAAPLARKMLAGDGLGAKNLAPSGLAVVDQTFVGDPITLGKVATGLLDVLPTQPQSTGSFAYLRQVTRTNNAAVVADFDTKPTSEYALTRVEQSLAVVAHLSQGTPRYWLADNSSLQGFISNEMAYGLTLAVEDKVFADIAAVSGKQTQVYSTSILTTLRKALTKLETAGWEAGALVMHPNDWESVELALASTNAVEYRGLPYDPITRRLFGVPVATTVAATEGIAHALAVEAVVVATDSNGVSLQWSETSNATDFSENLIRARCETRVATMVYRPGGIVVADLTQGS